MISNQIQSPSSFNGNLAAFSTMDWADGKGEERVEIVRKDPIYFLQCDSIFLKVENTLFRIPRYHLLKHSQHLNSLFKQSPGFSEEKPFIVDDIVTVTEFHHFLRIIIPLVTEDLELLWTDTSFAKVSKEEWISVLKISTLWYCLRLRRLAISKLEDLTALERIELGREYFISSWVENGYTMVVEKKTIITDEQMNEIGAEESFKLMRIMYEIRGSYLDYKMIKKAFQEELQIIAEEEKAYAVPFFFDSF